MEAIKVEYIYSALMLNSAGKNITEANVKKVIESTGEKADDAKVKALVAALDGVNIDEVVSKAAMPVAAAAPVASAEAPKEGEKKEEEESPEEQEKKAEEAAGGLASLFG